MPYQEVWVEPEECEELHLSDKQGVALLRIFDLLRRTDFPKKIRFDVQSDIDLIEPLINEVERHFEAQRRALPVFWRNSL